MMFAKFTGLAHKTYTATLEKIIRNVVAQKKHDPTLMPLWRSNKGR